MDWIHILFLEGSNAPRWECRTETPKNNPALIHLLSLLARVYTWKPQDEELRYKNLNKTHHTPAVFVSWGLGCWQSLEASGWYSDPEFSCWPTALRGPAGYWQLPPEKIWQVIWIHNFPQWFNACGSSFTLSIIIWAEGSTLSRASVQLSQGWAKTPSIVNLSSGFTFSSLAKSRWRMSTFVHQVIQMLEWRGMLC